MFPIVILLLVLDQVTWLFDFCASHPSLVLPNA